MASQRSLGFGETIVRNPRNIWSKRGHVLFSFVGSVYASAIHDQTWGKRICRGFLVFGAYAEKERSELIRIGNSTSIKGSSDTNYERWVGWIERGSSCVRPWVGFIRDDAAPWRYSASPPSWQTLRRSWVLLRVNRRSVAKPVWTWQKTTLATPTTTRRSLFSVYQVMSPVQVQ